MSEARDHIVLVVRPPYPHKSSISLIAVHGATSIKGHWSTATTRSVLMSTAPFNPQHAPISPRLTSLLLSSIVSMLIQYARFRGACHRTTLMASENKTCKYGLGGGSIGLKARGPIAYDGISHLDEVYGVDVSQLSGERGRPRCGSLLPNSTKTQSCFMGYSNTVG